MAKMRIVALAILLQALADSGSAQQARLVNGDSNSTGRLELYYRGEWSTVYRSSFSENDAKVVCRMLGYESTGIVHKFDTPLFGEGTGSVITSGLSCKGTEHNISECSNVTPSSYSHSYDVSISCSSTKIRLVGGDSQTSGQVEIFLKGVWSTVCDDQFDDLDARVVCSMLGYGDTGIAKAFTSSTFGMGSGEILMSYLGCKGNEIDIIQCSASWGRSCDHRREAGVSCGATGIRLANGANGREGRVELYHAGAWGTICDNSGTFGRGNAMVICRMLGYNASLALGYSNAFYGEGNGPVIAYNFACDGTESDIANCHHSGTWQTSSSTTSLCTHSYDVGVNCAGVTKIRLQDGDSEQSGRVELFRNGHWGTLGSTNFDSHDMRVICRMMGYDYSSASFFYTSPYYGHGLGEIVADRLQCDGSESDISFCHDIRWWPSTTSNSHTNDVGVNCDGVIRMRVEDGPTNGTGRLEIYHGGHWGTVCDRSFDRADLVVVCRSMGYDNIPESAYFHPGAYYGEGLGQILVYNLGCNGVEENIGKCSGSWPASTSYCTHASDVSVSCDGGFENIRLVNGSTSHEGRVEIYHDYEWWNICASGFDRADAVVICRMLNIQRPEHARALQLVSGTAKFLMTNLNCNGLEASLDTCSPSYKPSYCSGTYAAGVNCCPGCSSSTVVGKREEK